MSVIQIQPEEYYRLYAYYSIACESQREVRKQELNIASIVKAKSQIETINDKIYDPATTGSKKEFDQFLLNTGIMVEWKPAKNGFVGKNEEKDGSDVSG